MKIKNALKLPFSLAADIATLGNFGEGSYTGRVIDDDTDERNLDRQLNILSRMADIKRKLE